MLNNIFNSVIFLLMVCVCSLRYVFLYPHYSMLTIFCYVFTIGDLNIGFINHYCC